MNTRVRSPAFISRISLRILTFNLLLVFLPVAGFLYLDTYERQLLESLEHALVQQGRVLASSLGGGQLNMERAKGILIRLEQRHEARFRVVDNTGRLLADSSRLGPRRETAEASSKSLEKRLMVERDETNTDRELRQSLLYRIASIPVQFYRDYLSPPRPPLESGDFYSGTNRLMGHEIREALEGKYGAATRVSSGGQRSVTLYSVIPIFDGDRVTGAALVSQSTYRILKDIYELRLEIFKIFLLSIAAALIITLMVSTTIANPIRRLSHQAAELIDRRGRLKGRFLYSRRRDEIGELSRALQDLTRRLEEHIRFVESFASDVSHELKNPLASIRSATEIVSEIENPAERERFLRMIQDEVARMEHLLTGVREISHIDARLEQEERSPVDLKELAERVVEAFDMRENPKNIRCVVSGNRMVGQQVTHKAEDAVAEAIQALVLASPERLTQVLENLLDNAVSFSPEGGRIDINIIRSNKETVIRFEDQGPGIPEENLDRIFDRFVSYRAGGTRAHSGDHLGLGLSIVKAVVEGYGGSVKACNLRTDRAHGGQGDEGKASYGGACFEIRLPVG